MFLTNLHIFPSCDRYQIQKLLATQKYLFKPKVNEVCDISVSHSRKPGEANSGAAYLGQGIFRQFDLYKRFSLVGHVIRGST